MRLNAKIGVVHIGSERVSAALVKTGGKSPVIVAFESAKILEPLPEMNPSEVQAQAVRSATAELRGQAESWMLCIDSAWSVARHLTIPFRGRARVIPAVPFELEPHLAFPIEDVAVDFIVTAERPGETDVLAIAVQRRILEAQLAVCRDADLTIEGVGLDVVGVVTLFDEGSRGESGPIALLQVCNLNAVVTVLERRRLTHFEMLPMDRFQLQNRPDEAWRGVGNAVRSLDRIAPSPDSPLTLNVWGYAPPGDPEVDYSLPGPINLVFTGPLLLSAVLDDPDDARMLEVLAGCAHAAAGGPFSFNFLDEPLRSNMRPPGLFRRALTAVALCTTLMLTFAGFRYIEYRKNTALVEEFGQQVHAVFAETFPKHEEAKSRPAGDVGGFKSFEAMQAAAIEEDEARAQFAPDVFQRPTLLAILMDLSSRLPEKSIRITDMQISTGRNNELTVFGEADSAGALNSMLKNLRASELLTLDERRLTRVSSRDRETFQLVALF